MVPFEIHRHFAPAHDWAMIAPMATVRRYLSSLSLVLSASPVNDPVRDTLQEIANHFSRDVTVATVLVAIGVALEGMEIVDAAANWLKRLNRQRRDRAELTELADVSPCGDVRGETASVHEPKWMKVASRFGLILVVVGVVGEWRCGAKLEDAHNAIHQHDLEKITAADEKAGDAKTSADAVGKQADELLKKYDAAERELIELKAERMPRRLSSAHKSKLRQRVAAFAVKTIGVGCINTDQEGFDFEQDFVDAFRSPDSPVKLDFWLTGCNTEVAPPGLESLHPPIEILVGSGRQADAEILIKALVEIGIDKKQIKTKPDNDPMLLRIMVGPHAQWVP